MKFLVLHALAHRLQNWADFLIRQIGEGPVLPDQGEGAKTRAETEIQESETASEALSHSLSLSPEQEDLDMQLDGPPAHWLARVQKDAPDLLRQRRPARQSTTRLFGGPMVGPAPLPGVQQLLPFEGKARGAVQSPEPQRTLSGPVSKTIAGTAGASPQLSIAAPLTLSDQALPGTQLSERVGTRPATQALRGGTRPPEHVETRPAVQHFAEVPASFSVYKQQEQLKEEERLLPRLKQEEKQPEAVLPFPASLEEAAQEQRNIQDSIMPASRQELPSRETGGYFQSFNLPENAFPLWQQAPEVTSLPGATFESRREESSQQTKESATRLFLSPVSAQVWREASVQPMQPFRGIEVTTSAPLPVEPAFWPSLSSESPPSGQKTEESMQVEMPWPALPDEENTNGQDWGIAQRMWERRRRLDEEQRGNLWSV